jgi:hypothetical protein
LTVFAPLVTWLWPCCGVVAVGLVSTVNLLVTGDPEKAKPLTDQDTLSSSVSRLLGLLAKAEQYVQDVVVSEAAL